MQKKPWPLDSRTVSNLIVVIVGILVYVGLSHFGAVREKLDMFLSVLSPFIVGFVIAYLLNSPMHFFEQRVFKNGIWGRALSILLVYLLALAVLAVLVVLILPQVVESVRALVNNASVYFNNLNAMLSDLSERLNLEGAGVESLVMSYQDLMRQGISVITSAIPQIYDFGVSIGKGLISAITAVISSIYMLSGKKRLLFQIKKFLYAFTTRERADKFLSACHRANGIFIGFINGKLIDSAIIGVLCFILTSIVGIPFPLLVSVVVGATNIIPFFGPIFGAIPCVMILLIIDPWSALKFSLLVILLQQFDGNILGPKILGDSTGLSAIWVLVAIVVGGGLFGFMGMILGVPTFAVIYMTMRDVVDARLKARYPDVEGDIVTSFEPKEKTM